MQISNSFVANGRWSSSVSEGLTKVNGGHVNEAREKVDTKNSHTRKLSHIHQTFEVRVANTSMCCAGLYRFDCIGGGECAAEIAPVISEIYSTGQSNLISAHNRRKVLWMAYEAIHTRTHMHTYARMHVDWRIKLTVPTARKRPHIRSVYISRFTYAHTHVCRVMCERGCKFSNV